MEVLQQKVKRLVYYFHRHGADPAEIVSALRTADMSALQKHRFELTVEICKAFRAIAVHMFSFFEILRVEALINHFVQQV